MVNNNDKKATDAKKANDDRSTTLNPNNPAHKAAKDNKSVQIQKHKESEKQKGK